MDEYQDIDNIDEFNDYVTNTWIDNDPLFDYTLWNYFDFKSLRTNNNLEGWHHRLNSDLHNVVHPHFYLFIRSIQSDHAYNSAILSRHLKTGALPPRKNIYVNRNARLQNLEERFKQKTLTLDQYLEKVSRLVGIKNY